MSHLTALVWDIKVPTHLDKGRAWSSQCGGLLLFLYRGHLLNPTCNFRIRIATCALKNILPNPWKKAL